MLRRPTEYPPHMAAAGGAPRRNQGGRSSLGSFSGEAPPVEISAQVASTPSAAISSNRSLSWCDPHFDTSLPLPTNSAMTESGGTEETDAFQFMIAGSLAQARSKPRQPAVMMKSSQIALLEHDRHQKDCRGRSNEMSSSRPSMMMTNFPIGRGGTYQNSALTDEHGLSTTSFQHAAEACRMMAESPSSGDSADFTKPWLFASSSASSSTAVTPPGTLSPRPAVYGPFLDCANVTGMLQQFRKGVSTTDLRGVVNNGDPLFRGSQNVEHGAVCCTTPSAAHAAEKAPQLNHSYGGEELRSLRHVSSAALSLSNGWKGTSGQTARVIAADDRWDAHVCEQPSEPPEALPFIGSATDAVAPSALAWAQGKENQQKLPPVRAWSGYGSQQLFLPSPSTPGAGQSLQAPDYGGLLSLRTQMPPVEDQASAVVSVDNAGRKQLDMLHQNGAIFPLQSASESVVHVARLVRIGSDGSSNTSANEDKDSDDCEESDHSAASMGPTSSNSSIRQVAGRLTHTKLTSRNSGSTCDYMNIQQARRFAKVSSASGPQQEELKLQEPEPSGDGSSTTSHRVVKRTQSANAALTHSRVLQPDLCAAPTMAKPKAGRDSGMSKSSDCSSFSAECSPAATAISSTIDSSVPASEQSSTKRQLCGGGDLRSRRRFSVENLVHPSMPERGHSVLGDSHEDAAQSVMAAKMPLKSQSSSTINEGPRAATPTEGAAEDVAELQSCAARRHTFSASKRPLPAARTLCAISNERQMTATTDGSSSSVNNWCTFPDAGVRTLRKPPVAEVSPFTMCSMPAHAGDPAVASTSAAAVEIPPRDSDAGVTLTSCVPHLNTQTRTAEGAVPAQHLPRKYSLPPPSSDEDEDVPVRNRVRDYENMHSSLGNSIKKYENVYDPRAPGDYRGSMGDLNDNSYRGQLRRASEFQFRRTSPSVSASPPATSSPRTSSASSTTSVSLSSPMDRKGATPSPQGEVIRPHPRPRHESDVRPMPPPKPTQKSIYRYCSSSGLRGGSEDSTACLSLNHSRQGSKEESVSVDDCAVALDVVVATSMAPGPQEGNCAGHAHLSDTVSAAMEQGVAPAMTKQRPRDPVPAPRLSIAAAAAPPLPERRAQARVAEITFPPPPPESPQDEGKVSVMYRLDRGMSCNGLYSTATVHARSGSLNSADHEVATVLMASAGPGSGGGSSTFVPITGTASPCLASPSTDSGAGLLPSACAHSPMRASPDLSTGLHDASHSRFAVAGAAYRLQQGIGSICSDAATVPGRTNLKGPSPLASDCATGSRQQVHSRCTTNKGAGSQDAVAVDSAAKDMLTAISGLRLQLEELLDKRKKGEADIHANNAIGSAVAAVVAERCGDRQAAKYCSFVDDTERVTRLLLRLARRLAKAEEEAASALSSTAVRPGTSLSSPAELRVAEQKREQLQMQHEDAKLLKEGVCRQRKAVEAVLGPALDAAQFEQYSVYVETKVKLLTAQAELEDKILACEERIAALEKASANVP